MSSPTLRDLLVLFSLLIITNYELFRPDSRSGFQWKNYKTELSAGEYSFFHINLLKMYNWIAFQTSRENFTKRYITSVQYGLV